MSVLSRASYKDKCYLALDAWFYTVSQQVPAIMSSNTTSAESLNTAACFRSTLERYQAACLELGSLCVYREEAESRRDEFLAKAKGESDVEKERYSPYTWAAIAEEFGDVVERLTGRINELDCQVAKLDTELVELFLVEGQDFSAEQETRRLLQERLRTLEATMLEIERILQWPSGCCFVGGFLSHNL